MKKLIVNADDFGFTRGVNAAIIRAFKTGIVTSATIMANGDAFEDAVELARENPGLGVGCHLALVGGRPVADPATVPSLVDSRGHLPRSVSELALRLFRGTVRRVDIDTELRAQIERVVTSGLAPSHLDSHKHSHMHPAVLGSLARVAGEYGIDRLRNPFEGLLKSRPGPSALSNRRVYLKQYANSVAALPGSLLFRRTVSNKGLKTPDRFYGVSLTGLLDGPALIGVLREVGDGATELMCHPGAYDADLEQAQTRLKRQRERELEALTDASVQLAVKEHNISLISYREL
jgi:hopanoid biosynthesis associated protein HpnK